MTSPFHATWPCGERRGRRCPGRRRRPARFRLERPKREGQGDYSTNAAMLLAPVLAQPPREIAERLGARWRSSSGMTSERTEVAGPGFLNLFLSDGWHRRALRPVLDAGDRLRRRRGRPRRSGS